MKGGHGIRRVTKKPGDREIYRPEAEQPRSRGRRQPRDPPGPEQRRGCCAQVMARTGERRNRGDLTRDVPSRRAEPPDGISSSSQSRGRSLILAVIPPERSHRDRGTAGLSRRADSITSPHRRKTTIQRDTSLTFLVKLLQPSHTIGAVK